MDFDMYKEKIFKLLISKAKNNIAREAIINIKEIDISIKSTNDSSIIFQKWLDDCEIVEETCFLGKGLIKCIIKKDFI